MIELYNEDNIKVMDRLINDHKFFSLIYADMIYENEDLSWLYYALPLLKPNGTIIVQTDYHTVAKVKSKLDYNGYTFVNWLIYVNEWGGTPTNRFAQKHDDLLVYCNGNNWKWNKESIQIPKVTAGTKFDKKGTGLKTPCSVFYDHASFSTMSNERVKLGEHNIQWQKPEWLMERIMLPFTDEGDTVLDLFMGSGTMKVVCKRHNRNYVGIELDKSIFQLAHERE
jgi:DNA modification methylase